MLQNIFNQNQTKPKTTNTIAGLSYDPSKVPTQETPMGYDPVIHGFSGMESLGLNDVIQQGDGFRFSRDLEGGPDNMYQTRTASLNPDGTLGWKGSWQTKQQQSQLDHFLSAGLPMALAMAGGMYATGGLGGGASASASGLGTSGAVPTTEVAGSGLIPGTGTTGLQATAGGGMSLASPTGAGAGLSVPGISTATSGGGAMDIIKGLGKSLIGGQGGGISNLGNLASLFSNYKQYSNTGDLMDDIKGIYSPDGVYAKELEKQLARRDAAAGRNSQYGPRLAELMARLGDSQARSLSGLGGMMNTQQGGLNGMLGAGQRVLEGTGILDKLFSIFGD